MSTANQNLKYLRKLRGWTQQEFADKLRIKRSLLGAYEEERAKPHLDVLETICDIFKKHFTVCFPVWQDEKKRTLLQTNYILCQNQRRS